MWINSIQIGASPTLLLLGAATMAAPPRVPPTLLSLAWEQQAWRRIRSVHGRSTSGSTDQGQRPDGGVAGTGAVCCFCLRSLHVSSAPPVARLLFHSDLGQTVCSHTWSTSSFRRMYSCSAGEVVCAPQAKSDGKSQLDEVIHSKHISNLLCVGSLFCSEFVVGVSLLLSTWILSWMRATRRARSPSGPATASTISRSRAAAAEVDGMGKRPRHGEDIDIGCCRSQPRRRRLLLVPKCPYTLKVCRLLYLLAVAEAGQRRPARGGAEDAGQMRGRGRRPEVVGVGNGRGSQWPQKEAATGDLSNPAPTAAGARSGLGHEQDDEGCAVSRGGGARRGRQCIFPLCWRRRRWARAAQECLARVTVAGAGCRRWLGLGAGAGLELGAAAGERRKV